MKYSLFNFENPVAYNLYLIVTKQHKVKITPAEGMCITEKMMIDALAAIQKNLDALK